MFILATLATLGDAKSYVFLTYSNLIKKSLIPLKGRPWIVAVLVVLDGDRDGGWVSNAVGNYNIGNKFKDK